MHTDNISSFCNSPIGVIAVDILEGLVFSVSFQDQMGESKMVNINQALDIISQLNEYFSGKRKAFDLQLNPTGSDFMKEVWKHVSRIPYGETRTYGEIAMQMGDKKLTRAVGMANSKNPIPIIIPCHRVIGKNDELTGYAGGLWRKQWLLQHEAINSGRKELFPL
jgi:methylated-DNA-[protein]-cysteine S-methyltransferase